MKVLIFSTAYLPFVGGAELAVKEITDRLSTTDFSFDLITLNLDRKQKLKEQVGNIHIIRLSCSKLLFPIFAFRRARTLHRTNPYTCVWSIMASHGGFAGLFFKWQFPNVPFILTLQEGDSLSHIYRRAFFVWPLFKRIFTYADRITAISNYLADWARRMGATCPVEVIPNGVDVKNFQFSIFNFQSNPNSQISEMRKKIGFGDTDKIVITTSRLVEKNGIGDLILSMRYLPENVKLLVLGTGHLEESYKLKAKSYKLEDRIQFLGHIPHNELPTYLQASDVFIRPSLSEGMGSSFIEAMAAGLPVIATPVGGIPDFLFAPIPGSQEEKYLLSNSRELDNRWREKITGLFVNVKSPKDIAEKVQLLLSNDELRKQIIVNASQMVREKYEWKRIAGKMREVLTSGTS